MQSYRMPRAAWIVVFIWFWSLVVPVLLMGDQEGASEVNITWAEFKKLLNLDADDISLSWEEFRRLMAQTGADNTITYTVKNGKIILPREQFRTLLALMKPPRDTLVPPPADYVITKSEYHGRLRNQTATITANYYLEVFEKSEKQYLKIPFLPRSVAIESVSIDGKPGMVIEKNGWYAVTTAEPGPHLLRATFYTTCKLAKGAQLLEMPIPRTAITLVNLTVPLTNIDAEIPTAREISVSEKSNQTIIRAVLPATNTLRVLGHRKTTHTDSQEIKAAAKIYAETHTLLSIEADALRVNCRVKLSVLQNTITRIKTSIPDGYTVLFLQKSDGERLRDWKINDSEGQRTLVIPFDSPLDGSVVFHIVAERLFSGEMPEIPFSGFRIADAVRETGYIGAEKKSTAEAVPKELRNLDRMDIKDLPADLVCLSARPLLFGFRYLRHPYSLSMSLHKHEELPSISTVIDKASLITVVLANGKTLTRVVYTVRNTTKQFLELTLPADSKIWTVYVDGKRENASTLKGKIMVPLARSTIRDDGLDSFTVDLIYYGKKSPMGKIGRHSIAFPSADILVSKMLWSVYLPQNMACLHFSGNVEKEAMAHTMNLFLGKNRAFSLDMADRYYDVGEKLKQDPRLKAVLSDKERSLQSVFKNQAIRQSDIADQIQNEANLGKVISQEKNRGLGIPGSTTEILKIELPTTGQIYRFNKTVIEEEPITLAVFYISTSTLWVIKMLVFLLAVSIVFLTRKRIGRGIQSFSSWLKGQTGIWNFLRTKSGLRLALFTTAWLLLLFSKTVFIILALLFVMSVFRPGWLVPELNRDGAGQGSRNIQNGKEES